MISEPNICINVKGRPHICKAPNWNLTYVRLQTGTSHMSRSKLEPHIWKDPSWNLTYGMLQAGTSHMLTPYPEPHIYTNLYLQSHPPAIAITRARRWPDEVGETRDCRANGNQTSLRVFGDVERPSVRVPCASCLRGAHIRSLPGGCTCAAPKALRGHGRLGTSASTSEAGQ